jgi:hypothetical protein
LSKSVAKKKYLFTSDSLGCQQKTAISPELPESASAGQVLRPVEQQVLPVRSAEPEPQVLPEQTCQT